MLVLLLLGLEVAGWAKLEVCPKEIQVMRESRYNLFGGYRVYLTSHAWIITYMDRDFITINRLKEHSPGFILMLVELLFGMLKGVRTELRETWAVFSESYDQNAETLSFEVRAARDNVLEVHVDPKRKGIFLKEPE